MKRAHEERIKVALIEAIQRVLDEELDDDITLPWLGDDAYEIMAQSALAVLRGMADAQDYMKREGMLSA